MIRVVKNRTSPASLLNSQSYNGQDVRRQLRVDHHSICYLCERRRDTDFEIEHFKSKQHSPQLSSSWSNLLFSCSYCNNKKSDKYDNILNPLEEDIENIICQEIDLQNNLAKFSCKVVHTAEIDNTIELLDKIYNGNSGLRDKDKEEVFFDLIKSKYNSFLSLVTDYIFTPSQELKLSIIELLSIDQEILGLKYWLIIKNEALRNEFADYIIWNKQDCKDIK